MTKKTKTMKKAREYPTRIYLRKLQQGYMRKQREVEENYLAQQPPWLIDTSAMIESHLLIMTMRKNTFYSIKEYIKIPNKLTHVDQRA